MTAQHYREIERTIVAILGQLEGPASHSLRVAVGDGVAYIDGQVVDYRRKKAVSELVARIASPCKVVNRARVLPSES